MSSLWMIVMQITKIYKSVCKDKVIKNTPSVLNSSVIGSKFLGDSLEIKTLKSKIQVHPQWNQNVQATWIWLKCFAQNFAGRNSCLRIKYLWVQNLDWEINKHLLYRNQNPFKSTFILVTIVKRFCLSFTCLTSGAFSIRSNQHWT